MVAKPLGDPGLPPFSRQTDGWQANPPYPAASRVGFSERLREYPEFANRVPTSTPLLASLNAILLGLAPHRPEFSHSLATC
jgi:hypothetical protein